MARKFPGARKLEYDYDFFGADKNVTKALVEQAKGASRILFNLVTPGGLGYLKAVFKIQLGLPFFGCVRRIQKYGRQAMLKGH